MTTKLSTLWLGMDALRIYMDLSASRSVPASVSVLEAGRDSHAVAKHQQPSRLSARPVALVVPSGYEDWSIERAQAWLRAEISTILRGRQDLVTDPREQFWRLLNMQSNQSIEATHG